MILVSIAKACERLNVISEVDTTLVLA
jgi:hypothetical protein